MRLRLFRNLLCTSIAGLLMSSLAVAQPLVYLSGEDNTLARYDANGENREELSRSYAIPNYAAVDNVNGKFYCTEDHEGLL